MNLDNFQRYLIIINIVAFLVYTLDYHLYKKGKEVKPQVICNLVTTFGGALGTAIAEFRCEPKLNKINLLSRIYTITWLILQIILVLGLYGPNNERAKMFFAEFYNEHKLLCMYLVLINVITFVVFAIDKVKAMMHKWRIREIVLLGLALIGGSVGGFLAMDFLNHKVKSNHFMVGIPMMIAVHLVFLACIAIGIV